MEVELSKRSVKDLKSILREHKKTHCKPYSKLNKSQLIELIIFFNLLEKTDISKLIDSVPTVKPKAKKPSKKDKKADDLRYNTIQLDKIINKIRYPNPNLRKKDRTSRSSLMEDFNKVNDKIEELTGKKNIVIGINEDPKLMKKQNKAYWKAIYKSPSYTKEERDRLDKVDK
jgi:hypothetical protein